jgi:hypothetical protein
MKYERPAPWAKNAQIIHSFAVYPKNPNQTLQKNGQVMEFFVHDSNNNGKSRCSSNCTHAPAVKSTMQLYIYRSMYHTDFLCIISYLINYSSLLYSLLWTQDDGETVLFVREPRLPIFIFATLHKVCPLEYSSDRKPQECEKKPCL